MSTLADRQIEDIDFIKDVSQWPKSNGVTSCCLKKYHKDKDPEFAILISSDGKPTTKVQQYELMSGEVTNTIYYSSAEEIVKAGWMVD